MDDGTVDAFLGRGGTSVIYRVDRRGGTAVLPAGVLRLQRGEPGPLRPTRVPTDTGKDRLLEAPAAFVAYREADAGWKRVVATGRLEEVAEADYESSDVQELWRVLIPMVDIFERGIPGS